MNNIDEWGALAEFLSDMIAKYSDILDINSLPSPKISTKNIEKTLIESNASSNSVATNDVA